MLVNMVIRCDYNRAQFSKTRVELESKAKSNF